MFAVIAPTPDQTTRRASALMIGSIALGSSRWNTRIATSVSSGVGGREPDRRVERRIVGARPADDLGAVAAGDEAVAGGGLDVHHRTDSQGRHVAGVGVDDVGRSDGHVVDGLAGV